MDLDSFHLHYAHLQSQLQQLTSQLPELNEPSGQAIALGQDLIQFWQRELAPALPEFLPDSTHAIWRSLHTELHRELRLLNVDLMFLAGSKSPTTHAKKRQQVGDRLTKLEQYCTEILKLTDPHKPAE